MGTMNVDMPLCGCVAVSVIAKSVTKSARPPPVMNRFWPLMTQRSPWRAARARQLAQQATPLGPRRVLGLDLRHPTVRRGGRRQDLPLSEGPHRVHEPLLLRRVEERLAARDAPAAGHGQVVEADGAEQAGVEAHVESLPSPRVAWFFFGTSAVRRKVMTRSSFWFRTRVSTVTVPPSPCFDSRVSSTVDSA